MRFLDPILVGTLLSLGGVACASRDVPQQYPTTCAASVEAQEAKAPELTRALDSDPPLPGASSDDFLGWHGLAAKESAQPAPDHTMHQHHGAPGKPQSPATSATRHPVVPADDAAKHAHDASTPQQAPAPSDHGDRDAH